MPDALEISSLVTQSHAVRDQLLQQLDALVFIELGTLYFLDNSVGFLLIRSIVQISFISPRPEPLRANPQLLPVIGVNLLILLLHLFSRAPVSSEGGSSGYLHGGILVDFVGERGPISHWRLLFIDLLILTVQLVSLAISFEHRKIQENKEHSTQDIVAEEAGALRPQASYVHSDGIELQDLREGGAASGSHPSDLFYTDYTAISLDVISSLKTLARTPAIATVGDGDNGAISSVLTSIMSRTVHRP